VVFNDDRSFHAFAANCGRLGKGLNDQLQQLTGRRLMRPPVVELDQTPMQSVLEDLASRPSFSVVQIGAYIGNTSNDPIFDFVTEYLPHRPGSIVVLVEPISTYFSQLTEAYKGLDVRLENVAIADTDGTREMFRIADIDPIVHGQPPFITQLSSFREDRMTTLWEAYEKDAAVQEFYLQHRIKETVQCSTFDRLLDRHGLATLDLLQIDTEGYDFTLLQSIDFDRVRPRFVNYERVLLQADESACRWMMRQAGYVLLDWGQDTLCIATR